MPPRRKVSAPADRFYASKVPLKQAKFPAPKKSVKSYGKNGSKRLLKQDNTLTQMDFVYLSQFNDSENDPEEEDLEGPDFHETEAEKRKRRRKTTGDEDNYQENPKRSRNNKRRKTLGDQTSSESKFHTQTLTQIESWSSTANQNENDEDNIFDVPKSSQILQPRSRNAIEFAVPENPTRADKASIRRRGVRGTMGPPQTPRRNITQEIPSSQSPATPISSSRILSLSRSPLREKTLNLPIPFSISSRSTPKRIRKLEIKDTFDTETSQLTLVPTSPVPSSSPTKSVKFKMPEHDSTELKSHPPLPQIKPLEFEIQDSDEDEDSDVEQGNTLQAEDSPEEEEDPVLSRIEGELREEEPGAETYYGEIGLDTQMEAEQVWGSGRTCERSQNSQKFAEEFQEPEVLGEEDRGISQFRRSQRISTQYADAMAPRTDDSDIFISIHPQHVANIVNRTKDHEFRNLAFPASVRRVWMYETAPKSTVKYMASIGPAKRAGCCERLDENYIGNADFNAESADSNGYAYEILDFYELANPLTLADLKMKEWLKGPPSRWQWVRPVPLDELMGNLKPPIFTRDEPESSSTDAQEAEAQLLSTLYQFTQPATFSSQPKSTLSLRIENDSSTLQQTPQPPRPSQAETVDLSPTQTPRHHSLPEIIWESPTRPVASSTPHLPTPRTVRTVPQSSDSVVHPNSMIPFSMASSQLLTKSQMLPDSLVNDSVPGPPVFVQDSDEEDDEEIPLF